MFSPTIKVSDNERVQRPSLLPSTAKHIQAIQYALADHDALFENFFSSEKQTADIKAQVNGSMSFHARPRCSHDQAENKQVYRRLLFESAQT